MNILLSIQNNDTKDDQISMEHSCEHLEKDTISKIYGSKKQKSKLLINRTSLYKQLESTN